MRQGERGESERLDGGGGLRGYEKLAAIEALDPDAGERAEEERDDLSGEADDAKQKRRVGEAIDEPACGEARHPGADHGDALAEEEELEVAVAQSSPGMRHAHFRCVGCLLALFTGSPCA